MTKLARSKLQKEKMDIRNRYLAGEPIASIAEAKGVSPRDIYYHLGTLNPEDKATHTKNSWLRKKALPVTKNFAQSNGQQAPEPQPTEPQPDQNVVVRGDLVDFIKS